MNVTNSAIGYLRDLLQQATRRDDAAIRIVASAEGWRLQVDVPRPEDATIAESDRPILVATPKVAEALTNMTLDSHVTKDGRRLSLQPC